MDIQKEYDLKLRVLKQMENEYLIMPSKFLLAKIELCKKQINQLKAVLN